MQATVYYEFSGERLLETQTYYHDYILCTNIIKKEKPKGKRNETYFLLTGLHVQLVLLLLVVLLLSLLAVLLSLVAASEAGSLQM